MEWTEEKKMNQIIFLRALHMLEHQQTQAATNWFFEHLSRSKIMFKKKNVCQNSGVQTVYHEM